ncbi:juvenile hormone esterase-like [Uranotaenia lowii]|uniref:juvenile hormone esterase-like n=1 Tax=Uranotaenia lowii TaxID=190385 RepID=UPI002479B4DD|nr:juvenile hormone esterase-like [Uranotaenia lowii]
MLLPSIVLLTIIWNGLSLAESSVEQDDLRVCIEDGCLLGKSFEGLGSRYKGFLDVRYAKPPVGDLRFRNPQPVEPWEGDYDATSAKFNCVQKNDLWPEQQVEGNEDCLYLNVFVPETPKRKSLAVMMYIHGGGYFAGSSSMGEFGPDRFMDTGEVILVVIQYRLGVFGFLSTGDGAATGNFGLKDQTAALRWIQRNIAKFGGDPEKVTIFGQSAGGASVQMHMLSPLSRGLFSKAIIMSGSTLGFWTWPLEDPLNFARQQASVVGIESAKRMSSEELVNALRRVDAMELGKSIDQLKFWHTYPLTPYHTVVEKFVDNETFIAEDPQTLWREGKYAQVPWMAGWVPNEGAFASAALLLNQKLLGQLKEKSSSLIPKILGFEPSEKTSQMIRDRFFPGGTEDHWITDSNVEGIEDLYSETFIKYPLMYSVKQHIDSNITDKSSLQMYYFAFKGNHSYSRYFAKSNRDFGVSHSDDLSYLFRGGDMFDDFQESSPEAAMAARLVDFYVRFANEGVDEEHKCVAQNCKMLKFSKASGDKQNPVDETLIPAIDEKMLEFWNEIYNQE